jgi:hypothetical protein
MTPSDVITTYLKQARRPWVMFLIASVVGLAVAAPVTLWTDITYPAWKIFIIV